MPTHAVRAVVLDVNETLFGLAPVAARLAATGIGAHHLDLWFARVLRDGFAAAASERFVAFPDLARHHLEALARQASVDDPAAAAQHVLRGFNEVELHPDVVPALTHLAERDVAVATLTNGTAAITRGALERGGVGELVGTVLEVAGAGRWKPHPEPYRWAANQLGLPTAEVAMVAAHPWDVHGAAAAGMVGAWVDRSGQGTFPPGFEPPTVTGSDLVTVARGLA